ncbi:hypothetical protein LCGC14_2952840, partial [marine sediment metagenome]
MSLVNTPSIIKRENWNSAVEFSKKTIQALQQLAHLRLGVESSPTFVSPTFTGLTASLLVQTNSTKALTSVSDLTNWIAGTSNRVTVSDDGDGTITLSGPQDIHTSASPTFTGLTLSGITLGSVLFAGASGVVSQDNSNLFWDDTNNRLGVGVNTGFDPRVGITVLGDIDILHTASVADDHAFELDVDAAGLGDVKAIDINYITGSVSAGKDEAILLVSIDEIAAGGGDIFALEVLATEGSADKVVGLKVGVLIDPIHHDSGTFINPTTGTDNTPSTDVPEMIDGDSGPTKRTSIFEAEDEYI